MVHVAEEYVVYHGATTPFYVDRPKEVNVHLPIKMTIVGFVLSAPHLTTF
jgi:hypothetical protein